MSSNAPSKQRRLSPEEITQIQQWRYEDVSNDEMKARMPWLTDNMITTYAPTELRGTKLRLAKYVRDHPGIDYKDIDFRAIDTRPDDAAAQLYSMRRAGLVTFHEGRLSTIGNDHMAKGGGNGAKGVYDIRLTALGIKRVEVSSIVAQERSRQFSAKAKATKAANLSAHEAIVEKVTEGDATLASVGSMLSPDVLDKPQPDLPSFGQQRTTTKPSLDAYPILTTLRKRETNIRAANALVDQAVALYDGVGLADEALRLMEVAKTQAVFTEVERELMKLAEDMGL